MINFIQAVILGIVEGVTEFLPISSTAHLTLASNLLQIAQSDYTKSFEIIIQLGAISAVVILYWRHFLDGQILKKLFVAFLPTGIIGLALYKIVKQYLLGSTTIVLWSLALGGLVLIILERYFFKNTKQESVDLNSITYSQCLKLGLFQAIAIIPGVSRSAATIVGGLLMKINRSTIVEFSFLLAVPTMAAATGLDLIKSSGSWNGAQTGALIVGFALSFVTALATIRWLIRYITKHTFIPFGIYRIIIVALFLLLPH